MNTIQEYNNSLIDSLNKVDLDEYFKFIINNIYKNLDITFMDYFLKLCDHDGEFYINHIKLQEFKVINNIKSCNIKDCLIKSNLVENEDYQVLNVQQQSESSRGIKYAKEYLLTPYAFKLCLIRAKNSKIYANYYLLLEKVFKYYKEYQTKYLEKLLSQKDDKIDNLIIENKKQSEKIDKQSEEINKLLNYAKDTNDTLHEVKEENIELNDNINELNENLTEVREVFYENLDRNVPTPENLNNLHEFILLQYKNDMNTFKFIRGTKKYISTISNNNEFNLIIRKINANPINLYARFKEKTKKDLKEELNKIKKNNDYLREEKNKMMNDLKDNPKIKITYNTIKINNIELNELLNKIKECDNDKYNVEIP